MPKRKLVCALFLVTLFLTSPHAVRGDIIHWHYDFTRSPEFLASDPAGPNSAGTGSISFFPPGSGAADNSSDIVAFNIATSSSAPDQSGNPDRYTNKAYTLSLTLTDDA